MGAPARVPPPRAGAPIGPVRSRRRPPFCGAAPVGLPAPPTVRHRTAPPAGTQCQGGVSALRRHFAGAPFARAGRPPRIEYGAVGYTLRLGAHELDADVFRARVAQGYAERERGEFAAAAETLRGALALWRGPALAGLDGARLRARAGRLEESRLTAAETML